MTPRDYEELVAQALRRAGFKKADLPENPNQKDWDIKLEDQYGRRGVAQVKWRQSGPVQHVVYGRLSKFLTSPDGEKYDFGILITNTSLAKKTLAVLENNRPDPIDRESKFVYAAILPKPMQNLELSWQHWRPINNQPIDIPTLTPDPEEHNCRRIAVFTEKGGVGKTSVAAHLAGAVLHMGTNVVLVDGDEQKNLHLLIGEAGGVNFTDKGGNVRTLFVEKFKDFNENAYPDHYIVYDCAPSFNLNPPDIFKNTTDIVIPVVLSPLSILGNAEVITRTIDSIRGVNNKVKFHIIINQFIQSRTAQNYQNTLLSYIRHAMRKNGYTNDSNVLFYDPSVVSIRRSDIMFHWGTFLLTVGGEPKLAFDTQRNGSQNLLSDFLGLWEVIENGAGAEDD